jgi:uncharacterized RDD family membrane protein YckC
MTTFPADAPLAIAGHGRRLAASLLDAVAYCLIVVAVGFAGFAVGLVGAGSTSDSGSDDGWDELGWVLLGTFVGAIVGVFAAVALAVWLVRRRGAHNGQTLGKQVLGIRVARVDGREIAFGFALLRQLAAK